MTDLPNRDHLATTAPVPTWSQHFTALGGLYDLAAQLVGVQSAEALTIAAGNITPARGAATVDTEALAASDDLANIVTTNLPAGRWLLIRPAANGRTVVVKHQAGGAGEISLTGSADFSLKTTDTWLLLERVGAVWRELMRAPRLLGGGLEDDGSNTLRSTQLVNAQTGTAYAIASSDRAKLITFSNAAAVAATIAQAGANFLNGWYCDVQNRGAGAVTITPTTSTIDGAASLVLTQGQGCRIFSDGANYFTQRGLVPIASGSIIATAGEAIDTSTTPKLVYKDVFNQRGGGAARWYLVDTDATAPVRISPILGVATSSAAGAGNTFTCQVQQGQVSGFTGLTADTPVWASTTAGGLTQTEPAVPASGSQNAVRMVGYAVSATTIMFEPWHDTVFQARNSALGVGSTITLQHWTDSGARERIARSYLAIPGGTLITSGTAISNGDYSGQAAANAFDGSSSTFWGSSQLGSGMASVAYIGKDFTSSKTIAKVEVDLGSSSTGSSTWAFQYWNGSSWVSTGETFTYGAADFETTKTLLIATPGTGTKAAFLCTASTIASSANAPIREIRFYEGPLVGRDEPIGVGSETVNSTATDKVTVKFADASGANGDINTTFTNRTNAIRDIIVEVTL